MKRIDLFPYITPWWVHHQIDWAIKIRLEKEPCKIRVHRCSHETHNCGWLNFEKWDQAKRIEHCNQCSKMRSFAFKEHASMWSEVEISDSIKSRLVEARDKVLSLKRKILDQTVMTHFQTSKCDLDTLEDSQREVFDKSFELEVNSIFDKWSKCGLPDRIILFNGRIFPYCVPYFLAKELDIPTYIHERGRCLPYSFWFNSQPSSGLERIQLVSDTKKAKISSDNIIYALKQGLAQTNSPMQYPDLFARGDKSYDITSKRASVLAIMSSDDEVDCDFQLTRAEDQRSMMRNLIDLANLLPEVDFYLKTHPKIYGNDIYRPQATVLEYIKSIKIQLESLCLKNFHIIEPSDNVDTFEFIRNVNVLIGLHSSVLERAWLEGKPIITGYNTDASIYTPFVADFKSLSSLHQVVSSCLKGPNMNSSTHYNSLRCYALRHFVGDVNFGPLKFGDNFFQGLSLENLKSMASLITSKKLSDDFERCIDSIMKGNDIGAAILRSRIV